MKEKSFFNWIYFTSLFFLVLALIFIFMGFFYIGAVFAVPGIILFILCLSNAKKEALKIFKFVKENSVFTHNCHIPLTVQGFVDVLKNEGFEIEEYPYQNYYAHKMLNKNFTYHFFIANNDTPALKDEDKFADLFISKFMDRGMESAAEYIFDLEYGKDLENKMQDMMPVLRDGFIQTKDHFIFGYRAAYDTEKNILYYADAVKKIEWDKKAIVAQYTNTLLEKLFGEN